MRPDIEAIFIDVGDTLRILVKDEPFQAKARQQIAALVGTTEDPDLFCKMLDTRYKIYRNWAFETLLEAREAELWTRWLLPEFPPEKITPLANELTYLYRRTMGRRFAREDGKEVVDELSRRGYKLGIISNTITEREIPEWLKEDDFEKYFPTVVLSSIFGRRKPGTEIYFEATRCAEVAPALSAYVGDNPIRDVVGTRKAGFGMVIIMTKPGDTEKRAQAGENQPDVWITDFRELLDIFPPREITEVEGKIAIQA